MSGAVIISDDGETPLKSITIHEDEDVNDHDAVNVEASIVCEALHIPLDSFGDAVGKTLLVRTTTTSTDDEDGRRVPGMHAYHFNHHYGNVSIKNSLKPNLRATRLAMSMGLYRVRFYGTVVLVRESSNRQYKESTPSSLLVDDIAMACNVSPDLRSCIARELLRGDCNGSNDDADDDTCLHQPNKVPDWIANAAMNSYHDEDALSQLAAVMKRNLAPGQDEDVEELEDNNGTQSSTDVPAKDNQPIGTDDSHGDNGGERLSSSSKCIDENGKHPDALTREFVAISPLCFHCRGPAESLCNGCHAVYFCDWPRVCRSECWSHDCQCPTWRLYERRRTLLSTLPLGEWHQELVGRGFQLSSKPYEQFLVEKLKVIDKEQHDSAGDDITTNHCNTSSWWMTELDHGWWGGQSMGAKTIDVERRCSFEQGFHPIVDIPPDRPVSGEELEQFTSSHGNKRNEVGWLCLYSWRDYYQLRGIPESSPVALLLTFPLTLYHGITEYGQVPCTVARMLKRPLRIHVVGVEKELKLLDLFKEVSYLMPSDFSLELVFIVRDDMLPESLKKDKQTDGKGIVLKLNDRMCVYIVSGTYGDSIDPNFDCGTGAPDIVMAFNAGLYAYPSWRSVIRFLDVHRGVVGIFTDYNEYSGLGCASLGGAKSRESLRMNPFRQPRAMPVYSMNLPQFSNGFLYVYNQQELD